MATLVPLQPPLAVLNPDNDLNQRDPSIATDGNGFWIAVWIWETNPSEANFT